MRVRPTGARPSRAREQAATCTHHTMGADGTRVCPRPGHIRRRGARHPARSRRRALRRTGHADVSRDGERAPSAGCHPSSSEAMRGPSARSAPVQWVSAQRPITGEQTVYPSWVAVRTRTGSSGFACCSRAGRTGTVGWVRRSAVGAASSTTGRIVVRSPPAGGSMVFHGVTAGSKRSPRSSASPRLHATRALLRRRGRSAAAD